ncbi:unnamed protein product, partial [marine sediment metagenome]
ASELVYPDSTALVQVEGDIKRNGYRILTSSDARNIISVGFIDYGA